MVVAATILSIFSSLSSEEEEEEGDLAVASEVSFCYIRYRNRSVSLPLVVGDRLLPIVFLQHASSHKSCDRRISFDTNAISQVGWQSYATFFSD